MSIYFDNAATTKLDDSVKELISSLSSEVFGNPNSIHSQGRKAKKYIEEARNVFSEYLKCDDSEIVFTSCASESNNYFLKQLPVDLVITSPAEHSCVLESVKASGKKIHWLSLDKHACFKKEELKNLVLENLDKTILISLMYGNNEIGSINDIEFLSSLKDIHSKLFIHSDCVQALTKLEIDLSKLKLDSISCSAHKIHGSKGVGLIYLNKRVQGILSLKNLSLIHGGGQENGFRSGTQNVVGIAAFAQALKASSDNSFLEKLDRYFLDKLFEFQELVTLNSPVDKRVPGIFNLYLPKSRLNSEELVLQLDLKNICVSSGSACSSLKGDSQIISSYVLRACGLPSSIAEKSVRISLSRHNTSTEIEHFFQIIAELSAKFPLELNQTC
jgi:cysteine desulfurase